MGQKLGNNIPVSAGIVLGGQAVIETFGRAMVHQWDETQCTAYGCDQGHLNYLVHGNFLTENSSSIQQVVVEKFGQSFVMSLGSQQFNNNNSKLVDNDGNTINQK